MISVSNIDIGNEYITLTVRMNKEDMEGYANNDIIKEKMEKGLGNLILEVLRRKINRIPIFKVVTSGEMKKVLIDAIDNAKSEIIIITDDFGRFLETGEL